MIFMAKKDLQRQSAEKPGFKEGLQRAAAMCGSREQCSGDIRKKLLAWGLTEADTEKALEQLREEKYLDDGRYARFYTRDKFRFNGWGPAKIQYMLRHKEVEEDVIKQALEEISEEEWQEKCLDLIRGKAGGLKDRDPYSRRGKLFRFAAGRGFDADRIHRAIGELEKGEPGD